MKPAAENAVRIQAWLDARFTKAVNDQLWHQHVEKEVNREPTSVRHPFFNLPRATRPRATNTAWRVRTPDTALSPGVESIILRPMKLRFEPSGAPDRRGPSRGGPSEQSPLQARAAFIKNRSWELVVSLNRGACSRGGAQHGFNRETQAACASEWAEKQEQVLSLNETIDFLRQCHRRAPFLFFNGNTFADVGRQIAAALFADLPTTRRREVMTAVAHYIAGVLDRESEIVEGLWQSADFKPGDRVKTLRGSTLGVIVRVLPDGRIMWRPDDSPGELVALPESLLRI